MEGWYSLQQMLPPATILVRSLVFQLLQHHKGGVILKQSNSTVCQFYSQMDAMKFLFSTFAGAWARTPQHSLTVFELRCSLNGNTYKCSLNRAKWRDASCWSFVCLPVLVGGPLRWGRHSQQKGQEGKEKEREGGSAWLVRVSYDPMPWARP